MNQASSVPPYQLRLYVAGSSLVSTGVLKQLRAICEARRPGQVELEVVDLYQKPVLAAEDRIVASPTLIRKHPLPERRLVGDVANEARLLALLNLEPEATRL